MKPCYILIFSEGAAKRYAPDQTQTRHQGALSASWFFYLFLSILSPYVIHCYSLDTAFFHTFGKGNRVYTESWLNSCKWMGQRPEKFFSFILASLRWFQAVRPDFYFILQTTSKELVFFSKILWCCFLQPGLPSSNIEIFHFWIKKIFFSPFELLSLFVFERFSCEVLIIVTMYTI